MIRINPFPRSGLSSGLLSECLISSSAPQMFTTLRVIQLNIELRTGRQTNKQTVERPVSIASSHGLSKATVIMMEFVPYYALQLFMSINSLRFFFLQKLHSRMTYCTSFYMKSRTFRTSPALHFTKQIIPTSVSELISELRWQSLEDRRKNARLSLLYKGLHGLAAIPVNELRRPTRCTRYCGTDTFIVISSRIDVYKFSFLPRAVTDWNALPPSTTAKQSTDSFQKALYTHSDDPTYHC